MNTHMYFYIYLFHIQTYMLTCTRMYVQTFMYLHISNDIFSYACISTFTSVCSCILMHSQVYTIINSYVYTCASMRSYVINSHFMCILYICVYVYYLCACVCILISLYPYQGMYSYIYIYIYIHRYTCMYMCIYIYMYIHIYICVCVCLIMHLCDNAFAFTHLYQPCVCMHSCLRHPRPNDLWMDGGR